MNKSKLSSTSHSNPHLPIFPLLTLLPLPHSEKHALSAPLLHDLKARNTTLDKENQDLKQEQFRIHEMLTGLKGERGGIVEDVVSVSDPDSKDCNT